MEPDVDINAVRELPKKQDIVRKELAFADA
jgi:hypothetical protein